MRRRTADFLQGESHNPCIVTGQLLLICYSSAPRQARERGEGEENGKRKNIQSSRCLKGFGDRATSMGNQPYEFSKLALSLGQGEQQGIKIISHFTLIP